MANYSESQYDFNMDKWSELLEKSLQIPIHPYKVVFLILMSLMFAASIFGNALTCFIIYFDKSMHTTTNYYLFNLAVSDLILTFVMLFDVYEIFVGPHGNDLIICQVQWFLVVCFWNNSILTMAALAVERYIAIWYPMILNPTSALRRVGKIVTLLWIVAIIETVLEMRTVGIVKVYDSTVCFTIPTFWARILNGVLAILTFIIPLAIMIFSHSSIIYKVVSTQMDKSRDTIFNHRDPRKKISKLVISITVTFVICWLPFFVARLLFCALDVDQLLDLPVSWTTWFYVIIINSWISVLLNPILYSLMSTKFRKAVKNLWDDNISRYTVTSQLRTSSV